MNRIPPFAERIKKHSDIPILTGDLITTLQQSNEILLSNQSVLIWLGRKLLRNPYWILKAANEMQAKMDFPIQYKRAEPYSD